MDKAFEINAVVELFGHSRMAGKVTDQTVGSASFIRVDVPETKSNPAYTRLLNPSAIYAINPVTEEVMLHMAEVIDQKPIEAWDIRTMQKKLMALKGPDDDDPSAGMVDDDPDENPF